MKIDIPRNPYDFKDEELYSGSSIDIKDGINVLIGPNGSGKSTMIILLKEYLRKRNIKYFSHDSDALSRTAKETALATGKIKLLNVLACSSEGQQVITNIGEALGKLKRYCEEQESNLWVFFDAADSGLSIDMIEQFMGVMRYLIRDYGHKGLKIVISANNYEMTKNVRCINIKTFREITFKSYEDFYNFIVEFNKKDKKYS